MTPEQAVNLYIREARARFCYIPDLPAWDEWDTVSEFEARGGGDCDGFVCWTLAMAWAECPEPDRYWLVVGETSQGWHAWGELRWPDRRLWCDPTWGLPCGAPARFTRTPHEAYPVQGRLLGRGTQYV